MSLIENRAAENGSEIINDTVLHSFSHRVIAIRILEDTVITTLDAPNVVNVEYYNAKAMTTADPTILGNFIGITLTSGAVQAIFAA
jgi:hypothetical protein